MKLRRWMTEILLDVTTDMMEEVASEVVNRARMKGTLQPSLAPTFSVGALARGEQSLLWHCLMLCSFDSSLLAMTFFTRLKKKDHNCCCDGLFYRIFKLAVKSFCLNGGKRRELLA